MKFLDGIYKLFGKARKVLTYAQKVEKWARICSCVAKHCKAMDEEIQSILDGNKPLEKEVKKAVNDEAISK